MFRQRPTQTEADTSSSSNRWNTTANETTTPRLQSSMDDLRPSRRREHDEDQEPERWDGMS